ncbi:hypothetical protein MTR67_051677 [Solanum verrucosum]|uniref:Reverse transcriptase Ty1/copia-type domain-containing protein n=1 Tax=Solanum verrucosum TaxID=315347 RepID=A0AAF0ZZB3_SOLVR|nr:hypothetical protein MTR67_051677 [Solanum verrucosum]
MKGLGELKYFLGIEFARSGHGILMHQRKYALELISELGLSAAKPSKTPIDNSIKITTIEYDLHNPGKSVIEDTFLSDLRTLEVGVDRFKIPDIIFNPSLVQLAGGTASMQQLKEHLEKVLLEESPQAARVKVLARGNATERRFRLNYYSVVLFTVSQFLFMHRESALTIVSLSEYTFWFMLMTGTKSMGHLTFKENALKKDDFAVIFYG